LDTPADPGQKRHPVMFEESIEVECYSGHRANERPVAFTLQDRRYEIREIVDRWYEGGVESGGPELHYFKIRTEEGQLFLLRYDVRLDAWSTTRQ
jgi:hypothetical protein